MIKHSGIFSKALSLACCLALALSAVPAARAAEEFGGKKRAIYDQVLEIEGK